MVVKTILFIVFFSIGLAAVAVSILADDLNQYYTIKIQLHNTQHGNEKLSKLIDSYGEMIKHIESDPRSVERLATEERNAGKLFGPGRTGICRAGWGSLDRTKRLADKARG